MAFWASLVASDFSLAVASQRKRLMTQWGNRRLWDDRMVMSGRQTGFHRCANWTGWVYEVQTRFQQQKGLACRQPITGLHWCTMVIFNSDEKIRSRTWKKNTWTLLLSLTDFKRVGPEPVFSATARSGQQDLWPAT